MIDPDQTLRVKSLRIRASRIISHALTWGVTNDEDVLIIVPETLSTNLLHEALLTYVQNEQSEAAQSVQYTDGEIAE